MIPRTEAAGPGAPGRVPPVTATEDDPVARAQAMTELFGPPVLLPR